MALISLMHWHAIGTLQQAMKDMIRWFRASLRGCAIWLRHGLGYNITPVGLQ